LVLQLYPALVHRLPIQMAGETVTCSWYRLPRSFSSGSIILAVWFVVHLTEVLAHPIPSTSVLIFLGLAFTVVLLKICATSLLRSSQMDFLFPNFNVFTQSQELI